MMQKENILPQKQGVLYELSLGKNNGPFLAKDVMHNNPRSVALLSGLEVIKSFVSMNQVLNVVEQQNAKRDEYVDSIVSLVHRIENDIGLVNQEGKKVKQDTRRLHLQFERLSYDMLEDTSNMLNQYLPILGRLHQAVKESAKEQREQYYRLGKGLEEIEKTKKRVLFGIFQCEKKIIELEGYFGVSSDPQDS